MGGQPDQDKGQDRANQDRQGNHPQVDAAFRLGRRNQLTTLPRRDHSPG